MRTRVRTVDWLICKQLGACAQLSESDQHAVMTLLLILMILVSFNTARVASAS